MKKVRRGGVEAGSLMFAPSANLNSSKEISSMATVPASAVWTPIWVHRKIRSLQKFAAAVPGRKTEAAEQCPAGEISPSTANSICGSFEMLPLLGLSPRGHLKTIGLFTGAQVAVVYVPMYAVLMKICTDCAAARMGENATAAARARVARFKVGSRCRIML